MNEQSTLIAVILAKFRNPKYCKKKDNRRRGLLLEKDATSSLIVAHS